MTYMQRGVIYMLVIPLGTIILIMHEDVRQRLKRLYFDDNENGHQKHQNVGNRSVQRSHGKQASGQILVIPAPPA